MFADATTANCANPCDVFVEASGLMYMTNINAGLYVLEYSA